VGAVAHLESLKHEELVGQLESSSQENILVLVQSQFAPCHVKANRLIGQIRQRSGRIRFATTLTASDEVGKQCEQGKGLCIKQRVHAEEENGSAKGVQNDQGARYNIRLANASGAADKGSTPLNLRQRGLMRGGKKAEVGQQEPANQGRKSGLDTGL